MRWPWINKTLPREKEQLIECRNRIRQAIEDFQLSTGLTVTGVDLRVPDRDADRIQLGMVRLEAVDRRTMTTVSTTYTHIGERR